MSDVKKIAKAMFNPFGAIKDELTPDMPTPEKPKVAPVADEKESNRARQRQAARRYQSGRASTVLSEGRSSLG